MTNVRQQQQPPPKLLLRKPKKSQRPSSQTPASSASPTSSPSSSKISPSGAAPAGPGSASTSSESSIPSKGVQQSFLRRFRIPIGVALAVNVAVFGYAFLTHSSPQSVKEEESTKEELTKGEESAKEAAPLLKDDDKLDEAKQGNENMDARDSGTMPEAHQGERNMDAGDQGENNMDEGKKNIDARDSGAMSETNESKKNTDAGDSGTMSQGPFILTQVVSEQVQTQPSVSEEQQLELFIWMLSEKRKIKPANAAEKRQIDEQKALLKHFIRKKEILHFDMQR